MKKLRLLLSETSDRNFLAYWSQGLDLSKLPICSDYRKYDMITFVGWESQCVSVMKYAIEIIRLSNLNTRLTMCTSFNRSPIETMHTLDSLDGITITLLTQGDVDPFLRLVKLLETTGRSSKDCLKVLKVNVGKDVNLETIPDGWVTASGIDEDEDFMRFCSEQDLYLFNIESSFDENV